MRKVIAPLAAAAFGAAAVGLAFLTQAQDAPPQSPQPQPQTAPQAGAGEAIPEAEHLSYALGFNFGLNLKQQQIEVNAPRFAQGMSDAMSTGESRLSEEQLVKALLSFQQSMQQKQQERLEEVAQESRQFLEQNKTAQGVKVAASGLQYKVIQPGEGESPGPNDMVTVHYRGRLVDGSVFDSSYDRGEPAQFMVGQVIAGWSEALQMMKPGAKWELYIPAELAYGEEGRPPVIPPSATLIFEVELLEVRPGASPQQ